MRRRPLPPVDEAKRTIRRVALPAIWAVALVATVGCRSAAGLTSRTRGRVQRVLETVARSLCDANPGTVCGFAAVAESTRAVPERTATVPERTASVPETDRATLVRPTTREQIIECGLVPRTYVHRVLAEHGGRMKQCRFAEEYGWSASTISRLLSELEDEGAIERYRLGREKVVCLPEGDRSPAVETASPRSSE